MYQIFTFTDNLEAWCSLLSAIYAELIVQRCVKGKSKLEQVAPSLATHLMSKGTRSLSMDQSK